VAYFKIIFQQVSAGTEGNHEQPKKMTV
jgi:hypothetical protein